MRILSLMGSIFVLSLIFFTLDASSEQYNFDNLTVGNTETLTFSHDVIWVQGDILIDGLLTIENCSLNVNLTLDQTISEIRINSSGQLNLFNTSISTMKHDKNNTENIFSTYTLVSDAGNLNIMNTNIDYGMIWLVGGNANITNLTLNGYNLINYGIFSEDTNLTASNIHIQNYTLGLRSIGTNPTLNAISYYNCSTYMTQEWWVTFSPMEKSINSPIAGFEVRQWGIDGKMLGSWNWAKQYEINSHGDVIFHTANFTSYLDLGFAYIEDQWEQEIVENTNIIRNYDMNISNITYKSATISIDDNLLSSGQIVPKWSEIRISIVVDNPTDLNFNNLYLTLDINGESGFAKASIELLAGISVKQNLTWTASIEGPLSLGVKTVLVDYSNDSTEDITLSLSKFIEIETISDPSKDSGTWGALLAIFLLLCLCSYIVYNDMEEYDNTGNIEDHSSDVNEAIEEGSEAAITDEMEEE